MKKAKLLKNYKGAINPLVVKDIESLKSSLQDSNMRELLFYKHKCSDEWLKELLKRAKVDKKCLKKSKVRKILIEAVKLRMES